MGGRGAMSSTGKAAAKSLGTGRKLTDKEFDSLKQTASTFGITLDDSLKQLPGISVLEAYEGVRDVKKEFSQAPDDLFVLKASHRNDGALAVAHPFNGIAVNTKYFMDHKDLVSRTEASKKSGWSPSSGVRSVTAHEAGHILEVALIKKELGLGPGQWSREASKRWNKGTHSGEVMRKAVLQTNRASGTRRKKADIIRDLSRYAASSSSSAHQNAEGLAEAVSDFVTNQGTSKAVSAFVWDILKDKLG